MDVIYYYCFLFYKKILKEDEPHATTIWALGFVEGYFLKIISDIVIIRFFCSNIIKYTFFPIIGITLLLNYVYFGKSKRSRIVREKPIFFDSNKMSIILTIIFLTILISSMFWGGFYTKYLLENYCN